MSPRQVARSFHHVASSWLVVAASLATNGFAWGDVRADATVPRRFALQVAIEHYRWAPQLRGPRADVRDLRDVLIRRYQFRPGDFRTLVDSQATREGILAAIREHLLDNARRYPGALCVLQFSGHGSRTPDLDREPWEPDGWDETLVPWDGRDPDEIHRDVVDDEVADLVAELTRHTTRIVLLFDACNAGTMTRGLHATRRVNGLPPARSPAESRSPTRRVDEAALGIALFSSPPDQPSWVEDIGGELRSVFTYHLVRALEGASATTTYAQVLERVARAIRARFGEQIPFGEGELDQPVFGGEAPDDDADLAVRAEGRGWLRVQAGSLQGVTLGSTIAVRGPRADRAERAGAIVVEGLVAMLGPSDCLVRIDPATDVPEGARAFLRSTGVGYEPVSVRWAIPDGAFPGAADLRRDLAARFEGDPLIEISVAPDSSALASALGAIVWGEAGSPTENRGPQSPHPRGLSLLLNTGAVGLGRVFSMPDAKTVDTLEHVLRRVALAENLRRLESVDDTLAKEVSFGLLVSRRGSSVVDTLSERAALQTLSPGDSARVFVSNRSTSRLSVVLLHVGPDRASGVLFPDEPTGRVIEPGEMLVDPAWLRVELPCGLEHLKLLVTDHPVDLAALFEPVRTRGPASGLASESGSLGRLLWVAGRELRRGGPEEPVRWAVRDLVLSIRMP